MHLHECDSQSMDLYGAISIACHLLYAGWESVSSSHKQTLVDMEGLQDHWMLSFLVPSENREQKLHQRFSLKHLPILYQGFLT